MDEILEYMYNLERFGIKLGLEVISSLLEGLENPHLKFKVVHVAGTNGKGSVCGDLGSVLRARGLKVGLYTSPHLVRFNERVKINGVEISDVDLARLVSVVKRAVEEEGLQATFFEFTTAAAFLYFAEQEVDYVVVETGMGGRLDATNVVNSELVVITSIAKDHEKHLGSDLQLIAQEKAGVIKERSLVVCGKQEEGVLDVFRNICEEKAAELVLVGGLEELKIQMLGEYQQENANLAKKAAELLGISDVVIESGLWLAKIDGRLQVVHEKPLVLLDGAHNVAAMKRLREYVSGLLKRKVLVLGISEDKEIDEMVSLIVPLFKEVILTQGNYKPASLEVLEKECLKHCEKVWKFEKAVEAMKKAASLVTSDDLVLVTGSLYLVGDVLKYIPDFDKLFKGK